jgi:hypothetical protein
MSLGRVEPPQAGNGNGERGKEPLSSRQRGEIDVERLADQVYRLLIADARLTSARGGFTALRRKG